MKYSLSSIKLSEKPSKDAAPSISVSFKTVDTTLADLKQHIMNGYSFSCGVFEGSRAEWNWREQTLFALDFDIPLTSAKGLYERFPVKPVIMYETFSSKNWSKFRMVFAFDEVITDFNLAKKIQLTLMKMYPECDKMCKDQNRIYYPTSSDKKSFVIVNNVTSPDCVLCYSHLLESIESGESVEFNKEDFDIDEDLKDVVCLINNHLIKKGIKWEEGMKHSYTVTFAGMANRFGVEMCDLEDILQHQNTYSKDSRAKIRDIYKRYRNNFATFVLKEKTKVYKEYVVE